MKMNRALSLALAGALGLSLLAGCGGSGDTTPAPTETGSAETAPVETGSTAARGERSSTSTVTWVGRLNLAVSASVP